MADHHQFEISVRTIRTLNKDEQDGFRVALEEFIERHPGKDSWVQKVLLDEMLPNLMWGSR